MKARLNYNIFLGSFLQPYVSESKKLDFCKLRSSLAIPRCNTITIFNRTIEGSYLLYNGRNVKQENAKEKKMTSESKTTFQFVSVGQVQHPVIMVFPIPCVAVTLMFPKELEFPSSVVLLCLANTSL